MLRINQATQSQPKAERKEDQKNVPQTGAGHDLIRRTAHQQFDGNLLFLEIDPFKKQQQDAD